MLGRARAGFGVARVVLIDGADGREKRVELPAGESSSVDDRDEFERTEKRGCGCGSCCCMMGGGAFGVFQLIMTRLTESLGSVALLGCMQYKNAPKHDGAFPSF